MTAVLVADEPARRRDTPLFGEPMAPGVRRVHQAVEAVAQGRPVVVVDDGPDGAGDLVFAADLAGPELVAFVVRYTSGYVCVAVTDTDADRLELPAMAAANHLVAAPAYTVTVDARRGITTGISASDRARTIRLLAREDTTAADLSRPGHVVPLRVGEGGVLRRPRPAEAAVDLAVLAGRRPAGGLCGVVSDEDPTRMARAEELRAFAERHRLCWLSIADLVLYRERFDTLVERVAEATVPLPVGTFTAVGYAGTQDQREHVAFVHGDIGDGEDTLVSMHAECLTGDVFGSLRCDCGPRLEAALAEVAREGRGVVLYIRAHEGGGSGLLNALRAHERQDRGLNAVLDLPSRPDRDEGTRTQILADLGVRTVRMAAATARRGHGGHCQGRSATVPAAR